MSICRGVVLAAMVCVAACSLAACAAATAMPVQRVTVTPIIATPVPSATPDASAYLPENARNATVVAADTTGDGATDWLVLYADAPGGNGRGMIVRNTGGAGVVYMLAPNPPGALYREKLVAQRVADINGDGRPEILIEGTVNGQTVVNVFRWNGKLYESLLSLAGPEGVAIDEPQNDGVLDFTALQTLFRRSTIIRTTHAEWAGGAYRTTSDVLFLFGAPAVLDQPEAVTLAYYTYLSRKQPDALRKLLGDDLAAQMTAGQIGALIGETQSVRVDNLTVEEQTADSAQVAADLWIQRGGEPAERPERQIWRLERDARAWKLVERVQ